MPAHEKYLSSGKTSAMVLVLPSCPGYRRWVGRWFDFCLPCLVENPAWRVCAGYRSASEENPCIAQSRSAVDRGICIFEMTMVNACFVGVKQAAGKSNNRLNNTCRFLQYAGTNPFCNGPCIEVNMQTAHERETCPFVQFQSISFRSSVFSGKQNGNDIHRKGGEACG